MLFNVVYALLLVAMVVTFIYWLVRINRRKKLDAADYEEIEQRMAKGDIKGALEIVIRIVARHNL